MTSSTITLNRPEKTRQRPNPRVAALFLAAILAGCGGGGGGGGGGMAVLPMSAAPQQAAPEPAPAEPVKPAPVCSVWLEGDSILAGTFFPMQRLAEIPAAAIQRQRPAFRVVDRSTPGNHVALRMQGFLSEQIDTRFVVLEFGMNDGGNGLDYKEPLRAMVQRVKALGKTPIVTGLSRVRGAPEWRDRYNELARQVAEEEGAIWAAWGDAEYSDADMADDVHPAQAYSLRLVAQLLKALDAAAPECAQ